VAAGVTSPVMRIGAALPNAGEQQGRLGLAAMAERLETAGFDSIWVGDHIVTPAQPGTRYPYAQTGTMINGPDSPWYDSVVAMTVAAARTTRCEIGVGVLVLPLRHPITVGKQLASLAAVAGGRLVVGVGAGWMREEFDALGVPFEGRGKVLEDSVTTLRRVWSGRLDGMVCRPIPPKPVPILVGGMTALACERAGRIGDGWYAVQRCSELDPDQLVAHLAAVRAAAARRPSVPRMVLRITASAGAHRAVAAAVLDLGGVGINEIVVDVPWDDPDAATETFRVLDRQRRDAR